MTIRAGARLGPYEVLASLGAGGTGEVNSSSPRATEINLVVNWFEELKRRLPPGQ